MTKAQSTPVAGRPDGPEAAAYPGTTFGTRVVSVRDLVEAFGQSLGSVFFIGQPWLGLLLWGALLSRPVLALFALCGLLSGVLVRGILRVQDAPGLGGGVKANALLTAVVTGWMIGPMGMPWAQQLVLAAAAAMAAALVTAALMRVLARSFLPVLLWGYCLVAAMLFSVCPDCTVRAAYTFGWWHNESEGRPTSYLRDANGNAVYGGTVNINGRSFALAPTDFNVSNEDLTHFMHGLSVKSNTKGAFDWEVAASLYDYQTDTLRAATVALPAALNGGAGRIVNSKGTGWNTLAAKGTWRPDGVQGAHIVDFGLQRDSYQLRTVENATSNWINGAAGARNQAFNGDTQLLGLWAQDTWKIAPRWKAVLGARAERWSASNGQTGNATTTLSHPERNETYVSPKAAVAYQASDLWVLKASTGRAVRMPTVAELYQGGISGSGTLINNDPNLKPEKSWTTELTAERDMGNGLLRLTAFFERTKDALYSQTNVLVTPNVTNVQNVDAIRTKGLELSYQAANVFVRGLELGSSLTWTDSKITRNDKFPASVGKWQPRIPEWRASAVATYRPDDKWSYTLGARYSGKQYSTLDNTDPNGFAYQGASRYFTTDVRVRYQITKQVSAAVGIDNLNNYQFWNFHPYPQRTYLAELKVSL